MKKFAIFIIFVLGLENTNFSQNLDIDLLRKINIDRNAALDPSFKLITNSVSPIGLGAPLIVTSIGFIQKDQTLKNKGYYIGATLLTSALITTTLKFTIDKDRPFGAQVVHDEFVVHDLVPHIDRRAPFLQRQFDDLDGAVDAGAEPAWGGKEKGQGRVGHRSPMGRMRYR